MHEMSADTEKAKSALFEFMSAMKQWENKFVTLSGREHEEPEALGIQADAELRPIYERYVATIKDGRLPLAASFGYPPKFDPDAEKILSIERPSAKKVIIETLWTHPKIADFTEQHRYTMIDKGGEWRLDKKEAYDSFRNKWLKQVL
jgi:NTF2 fold immunity protein